MPKYRGRSDDWLDNESERNDTKPFSRSTKKQTHQKNKASKPEEKIRPFELSAERANAVVSEVFPKQCRVLLDSNPASSLLCTYRRAQVFDSFLSGSDTGTRSRTPVVVGDRVLVNQIGNHEGIIEGVAPRKNSLSRPTPGKSGTRLYHVLATHLDLLVIVASAKNPEFSPGLVDRFLIAAQSEGIPILICVTKIDLVSQFQGESVPQGSDEDSPKTNSWSIYKSLNYPVLEISVHEKVGMDRLLKTIQGKTVAFCGLSGVGKTSLLRKLTGKDLGKVGSVSDVTGKGKHTTTGALLWKGENGSQWIDTPGIKEFGLIGILPESLVQFFPEFSVLPCSRRGCLHIDSKDCQAIALERYSSYQNIYSSLLGD